MDAKVVGADLPLEAHENRCDQLCLHLPNLSDGQFRPQKEGMTTPTNTTTKKEIEPHHYRLGDGPTRGRRVHSIGGLHRPADQDGAFCPMYQGGHGSKVCKDLCGDSVPSSWVTGCHHLRLGSEVYQQVLDDSL